MTLQTTSGYGGGPGAPGGGWGGGAPPGGYGPPGGGWGPPGGGPPGGGGYGGPPAGPPPGAGWGPPQQPGGFGGPPGGFPPAPPPKKSAAGLVIALVAIGGVVALGFLVSVGYYGVRRYIERSKAAAAGSATAPAATTAALAAKVPSNAHRHLPAGCEMLLRVDVAKALESPAMKKHLLPALDDLEANAGTDPQGRDFKDFFATAGIEPKTDMKEAILCMVGVDKPDDQQTMVMVVGGDLRPEAVVPAFESVESPKPEVSMFDGRKVATSKDKNGSPIIVGQAADGAIVFASDRAMFEAAVKTSETFQSDYKLPVDAEASMVLARSFVQDAMAKGAGPNNPLARDIAAMARVVGTIRLDKPKGELRIAMATPRDAVRFNGMVASILLPGFKRQTAAGKSEAGELEALRAAKSRVEGSEVVVDLPWTPEGVDLAAQKLAAELRKAKNHGMPL